MKKEIFICDKCGEEIKPPPTPAGNPFQVVFDVFENGVWQKAERDLCKDCRTDLEVFLDPTIRMQHVKTSAPK